MWRLHWRRAIFYSAITKRQHVSPCVRLAHAHPHVRVRAICARARALVLRRSMRISLRAHCLRTIRGDNRSAMMTMTVVGFLAAVSLF